MPSRTRSRRPTSRRPTGGGTTDTWACLRRLLPRHRRDCGVQRAVGRLPRDGHGALHDRARRLFPHPDPERRRPGLRRGYGETEGDGGRHLARPVDDHRRDEVGQDHPDRRPRLGAHRRSVPADEDRHSPIDAPDLPQRRARRQVRVAAAVELPPRQVQVPHGGQPAPGAQGRHRGHRPPQWRN